MTGTLEDGQRRVLAVMFQNGLIDAWSQAHGVDRKVAVAQLATIRSAEPERYEGFIAQYGPLVKAELKELLEGGIAMGNHPVGSVRR